VLNDREAAEDDVAEQMSAEMPDGGHDPAHPERRPDLLGLSGPQRSCADDFLQGDDVRIDGAQHLGDTKGRRAPVHAAAAVNVVRGDPDVDGIARIGGLHDRSWPGRPA